MPDDLSHIESNIRSCLIRSTACPIEENREYWVKKMLYWQMELESNNTVLRRDQAHKVFALNLDRISENIAIRLGIIYNGYIYQKGILFSEFTRGSFECQVHCRDVESIHGIIKSDISKEEKKAEIKRILDIYSINQEQAQFSL